MERAPDKLVLVDIHDRVLNLFLRLSKLIHVDNKDKGRVYRSIRSMIKEIFDDIVTENLYWTKETTVATSERYLKYFKVRDRCEEDVLDLIEDQIVDIQEIMDGFGMLPSWSFFSIDIKGTAIVIHSHGDYRIEDWMNRYGKRLKKTRL